MPLNIGYVAAYAKKLYAEDIDITLFKESLVDPAEVEYFAVVWARALEESETEDDLALLFTVAPNASTDLTMGANNKGMSNERVIASWEAESLPDLLAMTQEWRPVAADP